MQTIPTAFHNRASAYCMALLYYIAESGVLCVFSIHCNSHIRQFVEINADETPRAVVVRIWRNEMKVSLVIKQEIKLFTTSLAVNKRTLPCISRSKHNMAKSVGETYNFPKEEENILELWKKIDAFKTSLKLSQGKQRFVISITKQFSKYAEMDHAKYCGQDSTNNACELAWYYNSSAECAFNMDKY